jgi:hypothetical protein
MTRSSATLSIFAEPCVSASRPPSFGFSIGAHVAAVGLVYFACTHAPRVLDPALSSHYSVRQVELHSANLNLPDFPRLPSLAAQTSTYPSPELLRRFSPGLSPDLAEAMQSFLGATAGRQTLMQPEFRRHLSFTEPVPLPTMMIWTAAVSAHQKIVPPLPQPATSASVTPSIELPNQEVKLAAVAIASTDLPSRKEAMGAGTTSPVETRSARPLEMPPATLSEALEQATPAAVLSISDVRMSEGAVFLPPVNDVAKGGGRGFADGGKDSGANAKGSSRSGAEREEVDDLAIDGRRLLTEHIVLPRDGKFSVVVVGNSVAEDYPDMPNLWANRMAYTAFLHVGLKKNWILQYSLTRAAEAADAGRVARLESPWPYDITRPGLLSRDLNADALMVHGVLNQAGRLESLAIAFPSNFRYASFVLHALRQWQFRPARQNGQPTAVEVLLIIPEELD